MNVNSFLIIIDSITVLIAYIANVLCCFVFIYLFSKLCHFFDTDMIFLGNELLILSLFKFAMVIGNFLNCFLQFIQTLLLN